MGAVNIPLLRKAVEWAEAEAAKPEGGEWYQGEWRVTTQRHGVTDCGTTYCIAGFVCAVTGQEWAGEQASGLLTGGRCVPMVAADLLGLDAAGSERLWATGNTIHDVRRIAEELAGERL